MSEQKKNSPAKGVPQEKTEDLRKYLDDSIVTELTLTVKGGTL